MLCFKLTSPVNYSHLRWFWSNRFFKSYFYMSFKLNETNAAIPLVLFPFNFIQFNFITLHFFKWFIITEFNWRVSSFIYLLTSLLTSAISFLQRRLIFHGTSKKCLAISTNKLKLTMQDCDEERSNQRWDFENYEADKISLLSDLL